MDTLKTLYRRIYGARNVNQLQKTTLELFGVKSLRVTRFAPLKGTPQEERESWVEIIRALGLTGT